MTSPAPTQSDVQAALRAFLVGILPSGTTVIEGQDNRVPQPRANNHVVMTPTRRPRISTNVDGDADCAFTGSILGTVLTVTAVDHGELVVGANVDGAAASTSITALITGTGGVGTYRITPSQTLPSSSLAAGMIDVEQSTMIVYQLDVHGPLGAENAQVISTLLRDDYGVRRFRDDLGDVASPLYTDDPRQLPFINAEKQYEDRWVVEVTLQANEVVSVPQQFADVVAVDLIDVDAAYPPS